jgi:hypothetical protein
MAPLGWFTVTPQCAVPCVAVPPGHLDCWIRPPPELFMVNVRSHRSLVVEDQADGREPLADVLRLRGYDVTSAADGIDAVACVAFEAFDVLVVDLDRSPSSGVGQLVPVVRPFRTVMPQWQERRTRLLPAS